MPTTPPNRLAPIVRLAPAKLNLTLAVLGRRRDGYHDLHSVCVPLGLADRLSLSPANTRHDSLHVSGADAGRVADNLVLRALAAVRAAVGGFWPGGPGPAPAMAVRLEKLIPVAAGLGGGSSDAASTIDAALEAWAAELDHDRRLATATGVGSDVPFFLAGGPALVEGRGELVTPLSGLRGSPGVLLVTPAVAVSTPEVFEVFDGMGGGANPATRLTSSHLAEELRSGLSATDLAARAGVLTPSNDLLQASQVLVPALLPFRRALSRLLARPIGLSGSGPTLWALYPSLIEAMTAAEAVRAAVSGARLPEIGSGPPFVTATVIVSSSKKEIEA